VKSEQRGMSGGAFPIAPDVVSLPSRQSARITATIFPRRLCPFGLSPGHALNELPHPQVDVALGLLKTNPRPMTSSLKSMVVPSR